MSALSTAWARLLVESLALSGIRDVVISPGSRSTPFVWAALHSDGLRCHTLLDERSAGFFAVGQAKTSGHPSLLVCTSGSAGAHYLPAVIEAAESGTPLVVLTADRPFELSGCGAPQTIDQTRLYGVYARRFVDLGMPDPHPDAFQALARQAAQSVFASLYPEPGPVHLNGRVRKPLEPAHDTTLEAQVDALLGATPAHAVPPRPLATPSGIDELCSACAPTRRGLIVCGPSLPADAVPPETISRLARATGFPVFAEATSQQRFSLPADGVRVLDGGAWLLSLPGFDPPEVVLQIGAPPTTAAWSRYLADHVKLERHVIAARGWPDPQSRAASLVLGDCAGNLTALADALERRGVAPEPSRWVDSIANDNENIWSIVEEELASPAGELDEPSAVRQLVDALPRGSLLVLGNSLPVREVDLYCRARRHGPEVVSQRGANGIDGLISGAAGAAVATQRPTTLLVGDLGFVHDLGGLAAAGRVRVPFTIAVLNNGGGRIFEQLPLADLPGLDEAGLAAWIAPHQLDLSSASALFGLEHHNVRTAAGLERALSTAYDRPRVLEIVVPPHSARDVQRRIRTRLEAHG